MGLYWPIGPSYIRSLYWIVDRPNLVTVLCFAVAGPGRSVAEIALGQRPKGIDVSVTAAARRSFPVGGKIYRNSPKLTRVGELPHQGIGRGRGMIGRRKGHWCAKDAHEIIKMIVGRARRISQNVPVARYMLHSRSKEVEGCVSVV